MSCSRRYKDTERSITNKMVEQIIKEIDSVIIRGMISEESSKKITDLLHEPANPTEELTVLMSRGKNVDN